MVSHYLYHVPKYERVPLDSIEIGPLYKNMRRS